MAKARRKGPRGIVQKRGRYYWRLRRDGREFWIPLGANYAKACARLEELQAVGPAVQPERRLVALAEAWLELCVAQSRNPKNVTLAQVRVRRYLARFFGPVRVIDVRSATIRAYRTWLEAQGLAPATVRAVLGDLRTCLRWAAGEGWIARSPFPPRVLPTLEERPPDRLSEAEVEELLTLDEPYGYILRLALFTGLRWGELTRLRAEDYVDGAFVIRRTKNKKVRRVPAPAQFVRGRVGLLVGPWDPGGFARAIRRRTSIAGFHVHQLRHTFACRWIEAGQSLQVLQILLGHSTILVTQRYAKLGDDYVRAEAARMGDLWGTLLPTPNGASVQVVEES